MAKKKKNEEKFSNDDAGLVGSLLASAAEKLLNFDKEAPQAEASADAETAAPQEAADSAPKSKSKSKSKKKSKIEAEEAPVEFEASEDEATVASAESDDSANESASEAEMSEEEIEMSADETSEDALEAQAEANDESNEENSEDELAEFGSTNIYTEEESVSFIPEANDAEMSEEGLPDVESVEGTELDSFEAADIEEIEFVEEERLDSILESILFASDRPVSLASLKLVFKGTNIKGDKLKKALDRFAVELASGRRGVTLEEVPGGYQIRTKSDNLQFLTRTLKARQFKLSGPALEVLAIVAYKQPTVKHEIDEIRGVESGHLLRALMEKGLVTFEGKSDLPGKPMLYATTKKFLEIFGLRNLKELPTLSQIDELLPEGMTEEEAKPTLSQVTDAMAQEIGTTYSEGEEELDKITDQLVAIDTSSEFFEQEKLRQKQKRDEEKAQNIREALALGESVPTRDKNWLIKYDEALMAGTADQFSAQDQKETAAEEKRLEGQLDLEFAGEENDAAGEELAAATSDESAAEPAVMNADHADDETAELEAALAAQADQAGHDEQLPVDEMDFSDESVEGSADESMEMTEEASSEESMEMADDESAVEPMDGDDDDRSGEASV